MAKKAFRPYNAFTVWGSFNVKDDELKDFIGDEGYFSSMFDFNSHVFRKSLNGWYASKDTLHRMNISIVFLKHTEKIWRHGHGVKYY